MRCTWHITANHKCRLLGITEINTEE